MRDRLNELADHTTVALVTFTSHDNLISYAHDHDLGFPILTDPDRDAYRAFGLGRGSIARVYGLKAARRYVELFRDGGLTELRRPTEDTLQLGGDFVIGADGSLLYGFWGEGPDDRPTVDALIDATRTTQI